MTSGLAERVASTDPRLLLPPRGADRPERLTLEAAVRLPAEGPARYLAVALDPSGGRLLLPLVRDDLGLRRARPGDQIGLAVLRLLAGEGVGAGVIVRNGLSSALPPESATETHHTDVAGREVFGIADRRVCLHLEPAAAEILGDDLVGGLERSAAVPMLGWVGEAWLETADGAFLGPVARASVLPDGSVRLPERLQGLVADQLRGADDGEPTLRTARLWGASLGSVHRELAEQAAARGAVARADDAVVSRWRREAMDVVAEAVVLAEGESAERLRAGRSVIRGAMEGLESTVGTPLIPAMPIAGPEVFVWLDGEPRLDPIELDPPTGGWHSPTRDVATCLRTVDRLARSVHRRFIGSGFPAPAERMTSWYEAVREQFVDGYREASGEAGGSPLFDERLLLAFEVEAECRSLSASSRVAPAGRSVSEAALAALLTPG